MSAPIKVPLRGRQAAHLAGIQQAIAEGQRTFEATVMGIAAEAEIADGAGYTVTPVLDGAEPHILLTPNEPPKPEKKP